MKKYKKLNKSSTRSLKRFLSKISKDKRPKKSFEKYYFWTDDGERWAWKLSGK